MVYFNFNDGGADLKQNSDVVQDINSSNIIRSFAGDDIDELVTTLIAPAAR